MPIQVNAPAISTAWFWVKRDAQGRLTWGIYPENALGDEELEECRKQYPALQFRSKPL